MSLPTYQEALRGPTVWNWELVAPWLDGSGLAACCGVSKSFNKIFSSVLWSDPIKVLATKKAPYYKTYSFMKIARTARREMRLLVHTLDFRPLVAIKPCTHLDMKYEDYVLNGASFMHHAKFFPRLRFAIMDGVKTYEGGYLEMARQEDLWIHDPRAQISLSLNYSGMTARSAAQQATVEREPHVEKRHIKPFLLSATSCVRTDRTRLLQDVNTANLLYLDLSDTACYSNWTFLFSQIPLRNLRILKLRGLRLTDLLPLNIMETGCRLWSLDVRNNLLSDMAIEQLLSSFFLSRITGPGSTTMASFDQDLYEDVPLYQEQAWTNEDGVVPLRPDSTDPLMNYIKERGHVASSSGHVMDENDPLIKYTGLTHLYISKNMITSRGINRLLCNTNRLQVLDAGSPEAHPPKEIYFPYTTTYAQINPNSVAALSRDSRTRLESLRIHHSIVSYVPTIVKAGDRNGGFSLPFLEEAEKWGLAQMKSWTSLTPLSNYRLKTLTLTDIPTKSFGFTIDRIISFLQDCAIQEEQLKEARANSSNRRAPQLLSGLRTLRLEFLPEDTSSQFTYGGSVSGDRDADTFLAESVGDFSFFDDPETMSSVSRRGSLASSPGIVTVGSRPTSLFESRSRGSWIRNGPVVLEKVESAVSSRRESPLSNSTGSRREPSTAIARDVVEELKRFRSKERKWGGKLELVFPMGR